MRAFNRHVGCVFRPTRRDNIWVAGSRHENNDEFRLQYRQGTLGWSINFDGVTISGVYGSKEAAFEAATIAATSDVRNGIVVQINVPSAPQAHEIPRH
jgi:hypothetical protein